MVAAPRFHNSVEQCVGEATAAAPGIAMGPAGMSQRLASGPEWLHYNLTKADAIERLVGAPPAVRRPGLFLVRAKRCGGRRLPRGGRLTGAADPRRGCTFWTCWWRERRGCSRST